jgi:DNA modification methylase
MATPYYQDDLVTLYHGDCREITEWLAADVLVTDPPYGIGLDTDYSSLNGSTRAYSAIAGDSEPFDPSPFLHLPVALFGANHFATRLPHGGTWHVWDKRVNAASNMMSDFEVWWTSYPSGPSRVFRYQSVCGVHPGVKPERLSHPTVKPLPLMEHVLGACPPGTVADPFAGSGSTLVAAKRLGRKAIGVELEERYCEIAAKRLAQGVLNFGSVG